MSISAITKDKLSLLDKRIQSFLTGYRQNLALFANDHEELSYLLENYFAQNTEKNISVIHLCAKHTSPRHFYKTMAISLLSNGHNTPSALDILITKTENNLPKTIAMIKKNLASTAIEFSAVIDTINVFIEESKKPSILVIDEFQQIKDIFTEPFEILAKFIIMQRLCMVILSSSRQIEAEQILSRQLNLLFGNFEVIDCNNGLFIDRYEQAKNALGNTKEAGFIAAFIANVIDDNTLYYKNFLENIKNNLSPLNPEGTILASLESSLYCRQTYFYQKFLSIITQIENTHKQPHLTTQILFLLSKGYLRKNELVSLKIAENKAIEARLKKLTEEGMIAEYGTIYRIKDRLFSFWLNNIFSFYTNYTNSRQRKTLWNQHMICEIALFKTQISKTKLERICQLAKLFKDDNFTLAGQAYKMPAMARTTITSYPQENMHVMIGEGKEIMVMGIKENDAQDNDIFSFAEKGNNIKGRGVRKFFFALGNMPDEARLAAKNQRLSALGINEINQVMKIYNQPVLAVQD